MTELAMNWVSSTSTIILLKWTAAAIYTIRVTGITEAERNGIIAKMAERGISTNVHFKPLPMMTAYGNMGWDIKDFPNSYDYYHNLITLPLHTLLSDEDVDFICETLKDILRG